MSYTEVQLKSLVRAIVDSTRKIEHEINFLRRLAASIGTVNCVGGVDLSKAVKKKLTKKGGKTKKDDKPSVSPILELIRDKPGLTTEELKDQNVFPYKNSVRTNASVMALRRHGRITAGEDGRWYPAS